MANKTISLDPEKSKRARYVLYRTPKAMAQDSASKNYKISERTIRSIEDGRRVKLSTAKNYSTILGQSVNQLARDLPNETVSNLEIDISGTQIFGSCSKRLLQDWRSHYTDEDQTPWSDLDVVRGTEREMIGCINISTLKPATVDQIVNCAKDYKSPWQSFLQDERGSHGFSGEGNQVPFIRLDLLWLLQPNIKPNKLVIEKLEQMQQELAAANSTLSEKVTHSAESMVQQLRTNSMIKDLVNSLNNESHLRFLFGELSSECVDTFTKKTLAQGDFEYSRIKRKVLLLSQNCVDLAQVRYRAWEVPKPIL